MRQVTTNVPRVTGRLRDRTLEFNADPTALVMRCYSQLLEVDDNYSSLSPAVRQDVLESIRFSAELWFKSILSGTFPSAEEMETFAASGRRRVHQGVTLSSLIRAFRVGSREIWHAYLELGENDEGLRDELLFVLSRYLLEHFDLMSQTISQAYLDEQYQRARWRDALRYELCSIVFSFPEDAGSFHAAAEALGLDPTVPRVALALDLQLPNVGSSRLESELDRLTLTAARHWECVHEDLVRVLHRGRVVIWTPCVRGDSMVAADRRMAQYMPSFMKAAPDVRAVGIGLMNQGPRGWAASVDEAFKALESGLRGDAAKRVHLYSEIAVDESVRRSDNVLRYLNSLLERLINEPELLLTLETYFDQMQRRKVAAEILGIHPNTLNHRLERIESLLGARLDDAGWIAKLHVAVKLWHRSLPQPASAPIDDP